MNPQIVSLIEAIGVAAIVSAASLYLVCRFLPRRRKTPGSCGSGCTACAGKFKKVRENERVAP